MVVPAHTCQFNSSETGERVKGVYLNQSKEALRESGQYFMPRALTRA